MRVTVSFAQTLDGRIATSSGDSQWIGGPESLCIAHGLRATHDAVLVGVGTVIKDNPRLTTRLVKGPSPLRVVADSRLRTPAGANVLADGAAKTLLVTTDQAPSEQRGRIEATGVQLETARRDEEGQVDIEHLVQLLAGRGVQSLLVEGGAGMITSVLRAGLCQRLVVCVAPKIVGRGIEAVGELGIARLRDALTLTNVRMSPCGADFIFEASIAPTRVRSPSPSGGGSGWR
jgi:5-amino-6-(5-phosphoribosylamino)uracil reductase/diaminohydroxyphosphoribosylaminopyrimidine deaminase/5-amino-6-(5-phosphoribosylamino)uracil reductase